MVSFVATLGFDERAVLRALMRHYSDGVSSIRVLLPEVEVRDERGEVALANLRQFLLRLVGLEPEVLRVNPMEFLKTTGEIKSVLISAVKNDGEVVLVLGGGMRGLVIEALLAALLLPSEMRTRVQVEVDLEYRDAYLAFSAGDIECVDISREEMAVLKEVMARGNEGVELREVAERMGIPRTSAWKIARRLERMDVLRLELVGRRLRASVTLKGKLQLI